MDNLALFQLQMAGLCASGEFSISDQIKITTKKDISELAVEFLDDCVMVLRLSPRTCAKYTQTIQKFLEFAQARDITEEVLRSWVVYLNRMYAPGTIRGHLQDLSAFFSWMERKNIILKNPLKQIQPYIHYPHTLPRTIPHKEIISIFQNAYDAYNTTNDRLVLRDIIVLEFLYDTGMRLSELTGLTTDRVTCEGDKLLIRVYGKGSRERMLSISIPETIRLYKEYCRQFQAEIHNTGYIMINDVGNRLRGDSVQRIIDRYVNSEDERPKVTPHMFRHTFATELLDNNVDIRYIQKLLGHAFVQTTEIYTHVSTERQTEILADHHPRKDVEFMPVPAIEELRPTRYVNGLAVLNGGKEKAV